LTGARPDVDVLVVGAGPVGTAVALDLVRRGRRVQVLEARAAAPAGSRAIGVHPPGLAVLERLGVAGELVDAGRRVRLGRAIGARGPLGAVRFDAPAGTTPFVLTVPQRVTERTLRDALASAAPGALETGVRVTAVRQDADGVAVDATDASGATRRWRAAALVGADGRDGVVRGALGVGRRGGPYPDRYAMADLRDARDRFAADEAWVVLHRDGVVEGFPLPDGVRRWVVRWRRSDGDLRGRPEAAIAEAVAREAGRRVGVPLEPTLRGSASAFGIERWLADRFAVGRVALIGDAAHVLSPIGGQGMNLGWLDAAAVAEALDRGLAEGDPSARLLAVGRERRHAARRAIARAAWNTSLGRPRSAAAAAVRDATLRRLLRPPWAVRTRARFVMEGLG
jgi:2-polyprenyl-6-methoxyphenol hydroxylase-like FAD-dependent oxidoreductase